MRRGLSFGVCAACAVVTLACGNNRNAQSTENQGQNTTASSIRDEAKNRPAPADVRGCLTASGNRFVLTTLNDTSAPATGQSAPATANAVPTTETYQLVSTGSENLSKYVGQEVRVTGEADPARVADVRELTPAVPAQHGSVGTSGRSGKDANGPKVSTEEETHFEYRKLRVSSVTPAGGACPATQARP